MINLSLEEKIPLVATNENFFLEKKFCESHDALLCISQQKYIDSENRIRSSEDFYIKTSKEMLSLFSDLPTAFDNTALIAQKCSFFPEECKPQLPKLSNNDENENLVLIKLSYKGLRDRITGLNKQEKLKYVKRLNYEIKVITKNEIFRLLFDRC